MDELPEMNILEKWYRELWLIRILEEHIERLSRLGNVPGFVHLSSGQEAVAVGVCAVLQKSDYMFSSHRAHGHFLAKGSDPYRLLSEILGRVDGLCGGFGGSMHLVDTSCNALGATGVVGGNIPLATGAAWAAMEKGENDISVVFFGDGAGGSGVFHETLNLAALWRLPVLFVCENNGYAEFTSREEHSNVKYLSEFTKQYRLQSEIVDGNDVLSVYRQARVLINKLRAGEGPCFLECMTYRLSGHYAGDGGQYRSHEELEEWKKRDPIQRLREMLVDGGMDPVLLDSIEADVRKDLEVIVEKVLSSPLPNPKDWCAHVYASGDSARGGTH